jgi:alkanesulfonate monooxygenase SsuD/methylene tetrahydromethanopterin reductase-like flavin-dependent oxidoreductase (luciferase family)
VWGTPDQVTEKLLDYAKRTDAGGLVVPLCFGGMDTDQANTAFEVFASDVLPELQRHDVGGDVGVTYDAAPAAVA